MRSKVNSPGTYVIDIIHYFPALDWFRPTIPFLSHRPDVPIRRLHFGTWTTNSLSFNEPRLMRTFISAPSTAEQADTSPTQASVTALRLPRRATSMITVISSYALRATCMGTRAANLVASWNGSTARRLFLIRSFRHLEAGQTLVVRLGVAVYIFYKAPFACKATPEIWRISSSWSS